MKGIVKPGSRALTQAGNLATAGASTPSRGAGPPRKARRSRSRRPILRGNWASSKALPIGRLRPRPQFELATRLRTGGLVPALGRCAGRAVSSAGPRSAVGYQSQLAGETDLLRQRGFAMTMAAARGHDLLGRVDPGPFRPRHRRHRRKSHPRRGERADSGEARSRHSRGRSDPGAPSGELKAHVRGRMAGRRPWRPGAMPSA